MKPTFPRCPACRWRLYYRKRAGGFVCKNWKCENYWKCGRGRVFELTPEGELREKMTPRLEAGGRRDEGGGG